MLTFAMRHGVAHTVVAVFIVLLSRECNIFVTGSCVKLLYYPRCLENKVVVLSTRVVMSPSHTFASMFHFGDEDGILYMHEDACEIQ